MGLFNRNNNRRNNDQYVDQYDDYDYDYDYDDDVEEEPIRRFDKKAADPAPDRRDVYASAPTASYSAKAPQTEEKRAPVYPSAPSQRPAAQTQRPPQKRSYDSNSYNASNLHKVDTPKRRRVEELYIADVTQTSDAMAVADVIKLKRHALIINLNPMKTAANQDAYISVINFIDGVCYVTDSVFKEIVPGSAMYLIYHQDIILNEGLDGYYNSSKYKY